ncbi:site-specific integrase [Altererythrobacter sp. C41]|uniref:site-specific integrase n=1 Tax=Altererythrobacter sp. C41 TaxID=2806021 RepID=UPI001933F306|nr:site-specific integrase [Altererythrobacter sp. C41]MBM0169169.1 tyrosine-type recombinase/integrase [Altererythrobacter sp. C41]
MSRGDGYSIIKRKRNGRELRNFEVRIQVPVAWRDVVGKTEVLLSLGTGDRRTANMRAPQVVAEKLAAWGRAAGEAPAATPALDPSSVAVHVAFDGMLDAMEGRRREWPVDDAEYAERLAEREADLRRMTRRLQDGDLSQWEAVADRIIEARGLAITKDSEGYAAFVRGIAEMSIDAVSVFVRRTSGELDAAPRSSIVRQIKARDAAKAKAGESLVELFDQWAEEMLAKGAKRPDTVNQDRKVIRQFAAFVGLDREVRSITPLEVADYRDTMRKLPPKWMSKKLLRDLDMRAAAVKARELGLPRTAFTNVNKHLSTISPLFKWLAGQPKWAGLGNPCTGLFHPKVKGKNPRPPFTTDDLNVILQSPLFTGFQADGKEHVPGEQRAHDWRYWIPLVAMFTGARIGEVAQLRLGDVRQERGVWFVHIRHDSGEGLATKSGKSRPAALHSMLESLGFLAFHERELERAGNDLAAPLFPELAPNARGQISGTPSRWWRDYLVAIGVKDPSVEGGDGFGSHSFRHTLADRLRDEAELLDTEIAVCLGHSISSTTSGYGRLTQGTVNKFSGWMKAVTFEGVDFNRLTRFRQ